jgi:heptosyltransferase-3
MSIRESVNRKSFEVEVNGRMLEDHQNPVPSPPATQGLHKGKKALFFHQGALGDFLVAAAAIDELARSHGFTRVDFWSKPEHVFLLAEKPYVGQCLPYDSPLAAGLLQDTLWRSAALPRVFTEADRIFIFGQSGTRLMAQRLGKLLSTEVHWIQSFPPTHTGMHVSDFLAAQLASLGLPITAKPLAITPAATEILAAKALLGRLGIDSQPILVHPGSGGRRKVWPLANWSALLDWMRRELPAQPLLSIGPADQYLQEFARAMGNTGIPVISGLTPSGLSALLSLCGFYIGSDSGVSHLAASVGVASIAVFGPTDPCVWAPRGPRAIALGRKWKEEDILAWRDSERPDFDDEQIISIIKSFFVKNSD